MTKTKWQSKIDSRSERNRRALHRSLLSEHKIHGLNQPLITNFFPIVNAIEKLILENQNLKQMLSHNVIFQNKQNNLLQHNLEDVNHTSTLLKLIGDTAIKNTRSQHKQFSNNNRYTDVLKKFCLYLLFIGGRMMYETLSGNLKIFLPYISTLLRFFQTKKEKIIEDSFRFKELKYFLEERHLPKFIWVSENATRITGKIMYDCSTNKLVDFV